MKRKILLIIRDGWGINKREEYNAVRHARTPNINSYLKRYPSTVLQSSGSAVGLPDGYQGSSEVGHLNMGAGRIVEQELKKINDLIETGKFFENKIFQRAINNCIEKKSNLHIMGLVQDEGVHSHFDHLFSIMKYAKNAGIKNLCIHFFSDGRDTPPKSAMNYLNIVKDKIKEYGIGKISTFTGRYYAMDRARNWALTTYAYNALTKAEGLRVGTPEMAIERSYMNDKTPDGVEMFDEYIPPTIIGDFLGIKDNDSVIHFNYRQDRAIQLTKAFVDDNYPGERWKKLDIVYCGLTRYYDEFKDYILEPMDESLGMKNLLGEVLSRNGLKQLRIAETQKFRHVTSFFNGKLIKPFENEDTVEIKSMYDPSSFAKFPQMNAYDVTDRIIQEIEKEYYDFIVLNYANCDMVGHTGNFNAAIRAVEIVDECVGKVVNKFVKNNNIAIVTADHGNAEEMIDYETGLVKTSHTKNPVEIILIGMEKKIKLKSRGVLGDIAPTILYLFDIEKPVEMTCQSLI